MIRTSVLTLAIAAALCGGCGKADQQPAAPSAATSAPAPAPAEVAASVAASDEGFTDAQLCERLTAAEVNSVAGGSRTAAPGSYGGCAYEDGSHPALHFLNSGDATHAAHVADIEALKGKCTDGPQDAALCAMGFDLQKGRVSSVWFTSDGKAVEIQSDGGVESDVGLGLLKAARQ